MPVFGQFPFQLSPQDCDCSERISLPALGDYFLQAAGKSADANGFGMHDLNSQNHTWVISRMAIEMSRFPQLNEKISIETWVEEISRAATTRNFRIKDNEGMVIGGASTIWAMMDIATRRAVDLKTLSYLNSAVSGEPSVIAKATRLPSVEGGVVEIHTVRYSDIDFNQHANSMKYVEWLLDRFSMDWHKSHTVKRFEINFLHEVLFGETVNIYETQQELVSFFEIKKQDGQPVCKMKLQWADN